MSFVNGVVVASGGDFGMYGITSAGLINADNDIICRGRITACGGYGPLMVNGPANIGGPLTCNNSATISGLLTAKSSVDVLGSVDVSGNVDISGNITIDGTCDVKDICSFSKQVNVGAGGRIICPAYGSQTYNPTAITTSVILNGLCQGTGDGASYTTFNTAINSGYGVGFIDTTNKVCKTYINVRTGGIYCVALNQTSDYRIKQNVIDLKYTGYSIDNLRPISYYNLNSDKRDMGFIAHEVQEQFPFLVDGEKDGENFQSLNYIGLIPLLVKELQELKVKVKMLEQQ